MLKNLVTLKDEYTIRIPGPSKWIEKIKHGAKITAYKTGNLLINVGTLMRDPELTKKIDE